ncbi:P22 phage major capsid protein family protein [Escherichia coli]
MLFTSFSGSLVSRIPGAVQSGKCRIAVWYSACAVRPEAIGVGLPNQTA